MTIFAPKANKTLTKAADHFTKLMQELDIEKYNLEKYKELFMLGSFQAMFDADLAYHVIYQKCAQNAQSKSSLLLCLHEEEKLPVSNAGCFDSNIYRQNIIKAIDELKLHILSGELDYLFM
ncbi:MAG: hypothetical protein JSU01_18790 [Bacteroidetes bacterium]|nr:hypothetical protein [Bacteroidota bacterium]